MVSTVLSSVRLSFYLMKITPNAIRKENARRPLSEWKDSMQICSICSQGIMDANFTQRFVFSSFAPKGMKKSSMVSW